MRGFAIEEFVVFVDLCGSNASQNKGENRQIRAIWGILVLRFCNLSRLAYLLIRHILTYTIFPFLVAICESLTLVASFIRLIKIFIIYSFKCSALSYVIFARDFYFPLLVNI